MTNEAISSILEHTFLKDKFDIKNHFELNLDPTSLDNTEDILDRFEKSEFLRKKNIFQDIKSKMKNNFNVDFNKIQNLYDRLIDDERIKFSNSRIEQGPGSSFPSEIMEDQAKFQILYKNLIDTITQFSNLLLKNFYESFNKESLVDLTSALKTLLRTIKSYLVRVKDDILNKSLSFEKSDYADFTLQNINNYNEEVTEMNKKLDLLEKIEYDKVLELKEKNAKLQMIKNHLESLKKENEILTKETNESNFYFSEQNEIILSYERSIKKKQIYVENKKIEIEDLRIRADEKNNELENLLIEIIEKENEINQFEVLIFESNKSLLDLEKKLNTVRANSEKIKILEDRKKNAIELKKKDCERLTEIITKLEEEINFLDENQEFKLNGDLFKLEEKYQTKIKQKVRKVI
jgi:hypothetical protein